MTEKKMQRYSISVSSRTYDRLRSVVAGSLAGFVDGLVENTLNDPAILARVVSKCHPRRQADT